MGFVAAILLTIAFIRSLSLISPVVSTKVAESDENALTPEHKYQVPGIFPQNYFGAPLHGTLSVSGSFGELRSNHFHSGIDFRTGGREGLPVLASADGYVSRIRLGPYGFGKAIYIAHPNGYTTVYGHLRDLNGPVHRFAIKKQYATHSFEQELYLKPGEVKVKKGDTIAWSGNTGGSGGPHLHFEIRRSSNDQIINPLLFGIKVKDSIDPFIKSILFVRLSDPDGLGYYPERISRQAPALQKSREIIQLPPGDYGLAYSAVDYYTDFASRLGINYAYLFVNDEETFRTEIEHFLFEDTRYINSHLDYAFLREKGIRYSRMFRDEHNQLRFYDGANQGRIRVLAGDTLKLKLFIKDLAGLSDSLVFRITGNTSTRLPDVPKSKREIVWKVKGQKENSFSQPNFRVTAGAGVILSDAQIGYSSKTAPGNALSKMHCLYGGKIPLLKPVTIAILPEKQISNANQYVIVQKDALSGAVSVENTSYSNGWVYARPKQLGFFYVTSDSIKPYVVPISFGKNLVFRISDNLSGIESYNCYIDQQWVLLEYDYKSGRLFGSIPPLIKPGKHNLKLVVKDKAGNAQIIERIINF